MRFFTRSWQSQQQALQLTKIKRIHIAFMLLDVISNLRCHDLAIGRAHSTKWLQPKLKFCASAPMLAAIELLPLAHFNVVRLTPQRLSPASISKAITTRTSVRDFLKVSFFELAKKPYSKCRCCIA
jgi:hypothetical protein